MTANIQGYDKETIEEIFLIVRNIKNINVLPTIQKFIIAMIEYHPSLLIVQSKGIFKLFRLFKYPNHDSRFKVKALIND